ncbi:hypothetical protein DSO57_1006260 [Entomophthora muscae]|uniref:Uncharacterized protein n=1 Tax=Entomophthora muscae TaxID=34485 RepID=A0ACC2TVE1_9FUNG|nr:hypothetical protein DSO57_1006260 [Entomophthora muscae]
MNTEHLYFAGCWETEQLLAAFNQPPPAFTPYPRVLDQEIIPAPAPRPSFPGVPLLQQLAQPSLTMSAVTGELPCVPSASSYDYSKLGFVYLTMLGLTEQVIPHMGVWRPWATAVNYVMQIVRANPKPRMGFKPLCLAVKQKQGQPRKPAGGFKPPATHQGR